MSPLLRHIFAALSLALPLACGAQTFPNKPVKIIVGLLGKVWAPQAKGRASDRAAKKCRISGDMRLSGWWRGSAGEQVKRFRVALHVAGDVAARRAHLQALVAR